MTIGIGEITDYRVGTGAFSHTAWLTDSAFQVVFEDWHLLRSAISRFDPVRRDLDDLARETRDFGWDGYRAAPVSEDAITVAKSVVASLPSNLELPEIGAESDGDVTLEWYRAPRRVFSMSVNADGVLYYSALIGTSRVYGSEPYLHRMADVIVDLIGRVTAKD